MTDYSICLFICLRSEKWKMNLKGPRGLGSETSLLSSDADDDDGSIQ